MNIKYKSWRIQHHKLYGFVAQKRVGGQWKHPAYYPSLGSAVNHIFEQQTKHLTGSVSIDLADSKSGMQLKELSKQLVQIKDEILEACNA